MFLSDFAISNIVNPMINGLSCKTVDFFISYSVKNSDSICQLLRVTFDAIFLALSALLAILVSLCFVTFSICLPKLDLLKIRSTHNNSTPIISLFIEHSVLFSLFKKNIRLHKIRLLSIYQIV